MNYQEALDLKPGTSVIYSDAKWSSPVDDHSASESLKGKKAGRVLRVNRRGGVHVQLISQHADDWHPYQGDHKEWINYAAIVRVGDPPPPVCPWMPAPRSREAEMAAPPLDPNDPMVTGVIIRGMCGICHEEPAVIHRFGDSLNVCLACVKEKSL